MSALVVTSAQATESDAAEACRTSRLRSSHAPADPGQGLGEHEVAATRG